MELMARIKDRLNMKREGNAKFDHTLSLMAPT